MGLRSRATTRFLLSCAAFGAAGGILIIALNWLSIGTAPLALVLYGITIGIWVLPAMIAQATLRQPGTALLVAFVMGLVNAPFTPAGIAQIPSSILFGIALELPFAILLYRKWTPRTFWILHPISLVVMSSWYFLAVDLASFPLWAVIGMCVGAIMCAFAFTGLAQLIARRLEKAGVGQRRPAVVEA